MDSKFYKDILNLSKFHREHEKYYAWAPLKQSVELQKFSQVLKTLADRWKDIDIKESEKSNPYIGCEDLNESSSIQHTGVLFMEGEGEPPEISRLKRDIKTLADDFEETGLWLNKAMKRSWKSAEPLIKNHELADVLGERHRIIINDWQAANLSVLIGNLINRSLEILDVIDFSPDSVRKDLKHSKIGPSYLYSASELIDRAADLASISGMLVHDNERRWRVFRDKIQKLKGGEN
jgi:hypothetical protein